MLVTTSDDGRMRQDDYVYVDWGPAFAANHHAAFPEPVYPSLSINLAPLAWTHLCTAGGSGYFRLGSVRPYLADGRLRRVAGAPEFSHSVYLVYSPHPESNSIDLIRDGLRKCFARH